MNIVKSGSGDSIIPKWYFTKEGLLRIPSILDGITPEQELKYRQQAAGFMQDMGEKLINGIKEHRVKMSCCMCVAMIHLHRFFVVHSMRIFDPRDVAAACLFLAGKSEEFPRKLELISRTWYNLKHRNDDKARSFDQKVCEESGEYIVFLESVVLQTIGFKLEVSLPHPLILRYAQRFMKDKLNLMETAYFFATDILFVTNWCVRYKMETLACVCIYLTCAWAEYEIPQPPESVPWYKVIDSELTEALLNELADEFSKIYEVADKSQLVSTKRLAERQNRMHVSSSRSAAVPSSSGNSLHIVSTSNSTITNISTSALLAPPPKPPQLTALKQDVKEVHESKPYESKQRKLTVSEYCVRKAATGPTPPSTNSSTKDREDRSVNTAKLNGTTHSSHSSRNSLEGHVQPSSSHHYNKTAAVAGNNASHSSNHSASVRRSSSTASNNNVLGTESSNSWKSSNNQPHQTSNIHNPTHHHHHHNFLAHHNVHALQQPPPSSSQQQQSWKRPYQKITTQSSTLQSATAPLVVRQQPNLSASPPSPKFVAFTDTEPGSPPTQRYRYSASGNLSFQPPPIRPSLLSTSRHGSNSASGNGFNSGNTNDLEDGELT